MQNHLAYIRVSSTITLSSNKELIYSVFAGEEENRRRGSNLLIFNVDELLWPPKSHSRYLLASLTI